MKFQNKMILLGLGLMGALSACSSSQTTGEAVPTGDQAAAANAGTDAVPPPGSAETAPTDLAALGGDPNAIPPIPTDGLPGEPTPPPVTTTDPATPPLAVTPAETTPPLATADTPVAAPATPVAAAPAAGETYHVQKGDTLMKIAFENYGDLFKWRSLYELNRDKISDPNHVPPGTILTLDRSITPVTVSRNGERFVIRDGDTLGTISDDVYGTKRKWRRLWENNKELIRDPNRIFAGFTLYYTFTEQDRLELEQFKNETKPEPLAQTPGAAPDSGRVPATTQ